MVFSLWCSGGGSSERTSCIKGRGCDGRRAIFSSFVLVFYRGLSVWLQFCNEGRLFGWCLCCCCHCSGSCSCVCTGRCSNGRARETKFRLDGRVKIGYLRSGTFGAVFNGDARHVNGLKLLGGVFDVSGIVVVDDRHGRVPIVPLVAVFIHCVHGAIGTFYGDPNVLVVHVEHVVNVVFAIGTNGMRQTGWVLVGSGVDGNALFAMSLDRDVGLDLDLSHVDILRQGQR